MGQRASRLVIFEDTAHGSYTTMQRVPVAGFRWERDAKDDPQLVENEPADGRPWDYLSPSLTATGIPGRTGAPRGFLITEFAKLKTPEDFLAFANRFGRLRHLDELESLRFWEEHTRRIRMLREIAKWVGARDQDKLAWIVRWPEGEDRPLIRPGAALDYLDAREEKRPYEPIPDDAHSPPIVDSPHGRTDTSGFAWFWRIPWRRIVEPSVLCDAEGRPRWSSGEVIGPTLFYVCDELNKAVRGHVSTTLMPFASGELFRVYVVPDCLLATIYLQLQLVLGHGTASGKASPKDKYLREWKPCGAEPNGCRNSVPIVGNKQYCSIPCRKWGRKRAQRAYREKSKRQPTR
jgi:hypothetical protein